MRKAHNMKLIPSDSNGQRSGENTVQLIAKREPTISMRFSKKSLKIFACLLILCLVFALGFSTSELSYTARHQQIAEKVDGVYQHVYLFDTEQKLDDFFRTNGWVSFDELKLHSQSPEARAMIDYLDKIGLDIETPEAREIIDFMRREQPLVRVGPFVVFVNNGSGEFTVREQSTDSRLIALKIYEQEKFMTLYSPLEQDWSFPRFNANFTYSENGVYKSGWFSVWQGERESARTYYDTKGIGIFDVMRFIENDEFIRYQLNDLTWDRVEEPPISLPFDIQINPLTGLPLTQPEKNENIETDIQENPPNLQ